MMHRFVYSLIVAVAPYAIAKAFGAPWGAVAVGFYAGAACGSLYAMWYVRRLLRVVHP